MMKFESDNSMVLRKDAGGGTPVNQSENVEAKKLKPKTRVEHFLAKIAGRDDVDDVEPKTRLEHFLADIAENCGCGDKKIELVRTDDYPVDSGLGR